MFLFMHKTKAQSILEYTMAVACLAAALFGMQIYIKRALQGRFRGVADEIGEQYSATKTISNLSQTIINVKRGPAVDPVTGGPVVDPVTGDPVVVVTPSPTTITGTTSFTVDPVTNIPYEIIETTRQENTEVTLGVGNFEETGSVTSETLY